jgi:uncharacterized protein YjbJ (UPF0337 family)
VERQVTVDWRWSVWRESCKGNSVHIRRIVCATNQGADIMNKDQVSGEWNILKGKVKQIWGGVTDDDFQRAEGSADKLYGTIQKRFGLSKEQIKAKIDAIHLKS